MVYKCAPGTIRTCDPQYRKLMLYPAELRVHENEKNDRKNYEKSI